MIELRPIIRNGTRIKLFSSSSQ